MYKLLLCTSALAASILGAGCADKTIKPLKPTCPTLSPPATGVPVGAEVPADVTVIVTEAGPDPNTGEMTYDYLYCSGFSNPNGDMDFSQGAAKSHPVKIDFKIDTTQSVPGILFMEQGEDAIWISLKSVAGPDGSPPGKYQPPSSGPKEPQFSGFKTAPNRRSASVRNMNNNGKDYVYSLHFMLNDKEIYDDPDLKNDGTEGDEPEDEGNN